MRATRANSLALREAADVAAAEARAAAISARKHKLTVRVKDEVIRLIDADVAWASNTHQLNLATSKALAAKSSVACFGLPSHKL
jgi:hypothetical protein